MRKHALDSTHKQLFEHHKTNCIAAKTTQGTAGRHTTHNVQPSKKTSEQRQTDQN
jgi:hypothetical protein